MPIQLFDSLERKLKPLAPSHPDGVFRFYNCGPTVYGPAHIGNFRTFVINDVLRRLLELEFGADKVKHVRNLTDVDDRTIGQAKKENRPLAEITKKWTEKFHADCDALNLLRPHVEPTATSHIREQVDMIECLMEKGNAYRAPDGSVYFKIASFPKYGALSRIKERELKVTNSAFDADHKNDLGDFALWKAYKPEEDGDVQWPGPRTAAAGRPGWHIECSAMIKKHLGETIDLHTGGVDLLFPHHENEIAQSQCCNGTTFARHWYHNEFLLVDGKKMSKSLGNLYTLDEVVAKGFSPMALRFTLLAGHPQKQLNFTFETMHSAAQGLGKIQKFAELISRIAERPVAQLGDPQLASSKAVGVKYGFEEVLKNLREDLNTPNAIAAVFMRATVYGDHYAKADAVRHDGKLRVELREEARGTFHSFANALYALGFKFESKSEKMDAVPVAITALAERRWAAKQAKDFATADALRKELAAAGWSMLDSKADYKLEPLKKS